MEKVQGSQRDVVHETSFTEIEGELYKTCVRSVLCYGAECWALKKEDVKRLQGTERRMIRMMCGKTLMYKCRSEELRKQVGVKDIEEYLREHRLRWFGHVERRDTENILKKVAKLVVEGERRREDQRNHGKNL